MMFDDPEALFSAPIEPAETVPRGTVFDSAGLRCYVTPGRP